MGLNLLWPVENYADAVHAYTESTNQIIRGLAIGVTAYLAVLGIVIGWNVTKEPGT